MLQKYPALVIVSEKGTGSPEPGDLCITEFLFNSDLMFLKPRLNRDSIP